MSINMFDKMDLGWTVISPVEQWNIVCDDKTTIDSLNLLKITKIYQTLPW